MARVLIADDEQVIRKLIGEMMSNRGHDTVTVASAEEALEELKNSFFDVLILDLVMPGMGGLGLLRYRDEFPDTAVIVLTAYGSKETAVEALRGDADDFLEKVDYLEKPVKFDALAERVERYVSRFKFGSFEADMKSRTGLYKGEPIPNMTDGLFCLFEIFVRNPDRFFTYDELVAELFRRYPENYKGQNEKLDKQVAMGSIDPTLATKFLRAQIHRLRRETLDAVTGYEVLSSEQNRGWGWSIHARRDVP